MPSNKKLFFGGLCSLFLLWYFLGDGNVLTEFAHAQGLTAGSGDLDLTQLLKKTAIFFDFSTVLMYAMLNLCSALLDPEFIFAINGLQTSGGAGPGVLLGIWQFSRNITNVILAFVLIFVALYTVIVPTKAGDFKTYVPKFILAVILVNFSWFFPRVILDTANVLTATIFSLPETVGTECKREDAAGVEGPCLYIQETWLFPESPRKNAKDDASRTECIEHAATDKVNYRKINNLVCIKLGPYEENFNTGLAVLHGLYVNHMRIIDAGKVISDPGPADGAWAGLEKLGVFVVQFMFVLFYMVATLFPLIAIVVVLLIRIPILWLTVAFMPFMFVGFVMGEKMGEANTMGIFRHFVKAAFLPAIIAIPLSVGFIMLNMALGGTCPTDGSYSYLCKDQGALVGGIRNLWTLLWNFVAVMVMWIGVFSAIKKVDPAIYGGAVSVIEGVGKNWGKFALQAPLALPLPIGKDKEGNNQSVMSLIRPELIANPNRRIIAGRLGRIDVKDAFRDGGNAAANQEAKTHTQILRKIETAMREGKTGDISSALTELSIKLKGSTVSARDVITSREAKIGDKVGGNGKIGEININAVLHEADVTDARERGKGAASKAKKVL